MNQKHTYRSGSITLGYKKSRNISQTRHFHEFFEILYIIDGVRDVFAGNRIFTLNKGDFLLIPPLLLHKSLENRQDSEIYSLYMKENEALRSWAVNEAVYFDNLSAPAAQTGVLLNRMDREFREGKSFSGIMAESLAAEISVLIARHRDFILNLDLQDYGKNGKVRLIIGFIGENYREDLTLTALADQFYMSPSYLSRLFHRETGFTLTDYVNHIRTLRAQRFLRESSEGIGQISRMCGFGSITHFGRIFKSISGMTPRDYRKLTPEG
ncbi:MAG: helix-turn-helix transcriptional regulator [Spirochaetales bacterium]|nr:helix-turn-helix transcriptional regulator [Spirochaetales bacterium]